MEAVDDDRPYAVSHVSAVTDDRQPASPSFRPVGYGRETNVRVISLLLAFVTDLCTKEDVACAPGAQWHTVEGAYSRG